MNDINGGFWLSKNDRETEPLKRCGDQTHWSFTVTWQLCTNIYVTFPLQNLLQLHYSHSTLHLPQLNTWKQFCSTELSNSFTKCQYHDFLCQYDTFHYYPNMTFITKSLTSNNKTQWCWPGQCSMKQRHYNILQERTVASLVYRKATSSQTAHELQKTKTCRLELCSSSACSGAVVTCESECDVPARRDLIAAASSWLSNSNVSRLRTEIT